jgi:hypothetical protein
VLGSADDAPPERTEVPGAEVVTSAVAQAVMGIDSDRELPAAAKRRLGRSDGARCRATALRAGPARRRAARLRQGGHAAGHEVQRGALERFGATALRPARAGERGGGPALSWIRRRIGSISWTLKDRLGLE